MVRPALVAVDDEPGMLEDVERELRDRYARDYEVVCVGSADEALVRLEALAAGGEAALVLVGHSLWGTTGRALLKGVRHRYPHAKRGLLIDWGAWGDPATGEA